MTVAAVCDYDIPVDPPLPTSPKPPPVTREVLITGRVVDARGAAVANALVGWRLDSCDPVSDHREVAKTASDGSFQLIWTLLPDEQVGSFLSIRGAGFFPVVQAIQIGPRAGPRIDAGTIMIKDWIDAADELKHGKLAP